MHCCSILEIVHLTLLMAPLVATVRQSGFLLDNLFLLWLVKQCFYDVSCGGGIVEDGGLWSFLVKSGFLNMVIFASY